MRHWFESLEVREQLFVGIGALVVVLAIAYAFIWSPLERNHTAKMANVSDWQRSLAELRPLKGVLQNAAQSPGSGRASARQAPIIVVDQTLRSRGLEQFRKRSQPTSSNGIRVEFENVAFDDLIQWLGDLSVQYAMHVQAGSVSLGSQSGPGRVNATLTLERAL